MNKQYITPAIETYDVMKQSILADSSLPKSGTEIEGPVLSKDNIFDILDGTGIDLGSDLNLDLDFSE